MNEHIHRSRSHEGDGMSKLGKAVHAVKEVMCDDLGHELFEVKDDFLEFHCPVRFM